MLKPKLKNQRSHKVLACSLPRIYCCSHLETLILKKKRKNNTTESCKPGTAFVLQSFLFDPRPKTQTQFSSLLLYSLGATILYCPEGRQKLRNWTAVNTESSGKAMSLTCQLSELVSHQEMKFT